MKNKNYDILINELVDAFKKAEIEESKYDFFEADEFQKRFKSLLGFVCILGAINENYTDIKVKEIDRSYIIDKYHLFIKNRSAFRDEDIDNLFKFIESVDKLYPPDTLISKWENAFGKGSFFTISINKNYRKGLHAIVKKNVFDAYMNNLFYKSKKYKIWKILNEKGA